MRVTHAENLCVDYNCAHYMQIKWWDATSG